MRNHLNLVISGTPKRFYTMNRKPDSHAHSCTQRLPCHRVTQCMLISSCVNGMCYWLILHGVRLIATMALLLSPWSLWSNCQAAGCHAMRHAAWMPPLSMAQNPSNPQVIMHDTTALQSAHSSGREGKYEPTTSDDFYLQKNSVLKS